MTATIFSQLLSLCRVVLPQVPLPASPHHTLGQQLAIGDQHLDPFQYFLKTLVLFPPVRRWGVNGTQSVKVYLGPRRSELVIKFARLNIDWPDMTTNLGVW